jgi:flagellar hook protein FlgE
MSLYSAMRSGVSGMSAQSSRLAAISDNISNSATVGYKRADVDFSTLVTSSGSKSMYAAGGVGSNVHYQVQKDGIIQGTQSTTDMAIDGRGFFVVANGATAAGGGSLTYGLTRAGSFQPNDQGYLRNSAGLYLQGWALNADGTLPTVSKTDFSSVVPVNVSNITYGGSATGRMNFSGNLPAQATTGNTFTTTSPFYDGLGNARDVTMTWTKTANPQEWSVAVTGPAGYTVAGAPATITFNATGPTAGLPSAALPTITLTSPATPTADTITLGMSNLTQLNGDYVPQLVGDGSAVGRVSSVQIDESGKLWALFDNGATKALYQIPVADVINPDGLNVADGNMYTLGADSGPLTLNIGKSGAVGSVQGSSLEESNVDIADELVSLIETQRAYSSNATIVRTTDEMLEETTHLKR